MADDFTGAMDAGLGFHGAGARVRVTLWNRGRLPSPPAGTDVWAIDTESRFLPPRAAAVRVTAAVRALQKWGASRFYKKVDSALRGPVRAELAAFAATIDAGPRRVAFVPAFPRVGRTTRRGVQRVFGKPLHKSIFARDPKNPVRAGTFRTLFGPKLFRRLWTPDVARQEDLRRIAAELSRRPDVAPWAAAGAAGLCEFLAATWVVPSKKKPAPRGGKKYRAPVLVAVGSQNPVSRKQLARLKEACLLTEMPNSAKTSLKDKLFLVSSPDRPGNPRNVLNDVVRRADALVRRAGVRRVVATGGETAAGLCARWGLFSWRLLDRVDTGVALCAPDGKTHPLLVTKPGAFGNEDALLAAARRLSRAN